jgi:mRNA-degrading endonuclease toxin of MazEF toxin-antitoxin module
MVRGEIYWADLHPRSGSEQSGRKPVLIVSHDGFNCVPAWRSVIVVPLSTSVNKLTERVGALPKMHLVDVEQGLLFAMGLAG